MALVEYLEILRGPDLHHLNASLTVGDRSHRFSVTFDVKRAECGMAGEARIRVNINGLRREDGSGHNWLIDGYIISAVNASYGLDMALPGNKFDGFYFTDARNGYISTG